MYEMDEMTTEELLLTVKHYVEVGQCHFVLRRGRNYQQDLLNLGIQSVEEAWQEILRLKVRDSYKPPERDHSDPTNRVFFFKKELNQRIAYIKLKIVPGRGAVCISFHPSE